MNTQDNEPYYDDDEHMPAKKVVDEKQPDRSTVKGKCCCSQYEAKGVKYCCAKEELSM